VLFWVTGSDYGHDVSEVKSSACVLVVREHAAKPRKGQVNTVKQVMQIVCVVAILALGSVGMAGEVAHYSFDTSFADSSGNGLDATSSRPPLLVDYDGKFGTCADFESDSRSLLEVSNDPVFSYLENMTIGVWLKPESWNGPRRIFQKGNDGDWRLRGGSSFLFSQNGRTAYADGDSSVHFPLGQWTHVAAVVNTADDEIKIYQNGSEIASTSLQGRGINRNTSSLIIGAKELSNMYEGDYIDGLMDEFHIYSDALTSQQIGELMTTNAVANLPPVPTTPTDPPDPPDLPDPSGFDASLEIEALIDGRDHLIIKGDTMQWEHFDWQAVGRYRDQNEPTTITTTLDGQTVQDGVDWIPEWSIPAPAQIWDHESSSIFTGLSPEFPELNQTVALVALEARGDMRIVQQPSIDNEYTLIVEFNDNSPGGPDTYHAKLYYQVPEPATLSLLTLGGLALVRRRKQGDSK